MSVTKTFNGTVYTLPTENEVGWADEVTNFLSDVADNAATKTGTQSLTNKTLVSPTITGSLSVPNDSISGNAIDGGIISNFESIGIDDNASNRVIEISAGDAVTIYGDTTFDSGTELVLTGVTVTGLDRVTSVDTGTGLSGGPITSTGTISLANTAVTPGSYTLANVTVDAQGRITAASNGSAALDITGLSASTTADDADLIVIYDDTAGANRKQTRAHFLAGISGTGTVTQVDAGAGLGGGPITATGALTLDFTTLSAETSIDNNDLVAIYDDTAGAMRKMTRANFIAGISGVGTVTSITAGTGLSGGAITSSGTIALDINGLTEETTNASNDTIPIYDASGAVIRKMTRANFLNGAGTVTSVSAGSGLSGGPITSTGTLAVDIHGTTEETLNAGNDEILIYDTSAAALRRMTRTNFLSGAGTVTSITPGVGLSGSAITTSGTIDLDINDITAETTVANDDLVAIYDSSASATRKMTLNNLFKGKHTLWIPAGAMVPRGTNGPEEATVDLTNQTLRVLKFDASTQESAQFDVAFNKGYDNGTVTAQVYWAHASTTTNFGTAWSIAGVAVSNDDPLDASFGSAQTVTDTGGTTTDLYITSASSNITLGGTPQTGDLVRFQIDRVPSNGSDTLAIDAMLLGVKIVYTVSARDDS